MAKVLLVEDDRDLSTTVIDALRDDRYIVESAENGNDGANLLKLEEFDIIILDWDLPGKSGVEILKEFRATGKTTPIIMLTGRTHINNKEEGMESGADDYLTKPFDMRELKARLRALLRRATGVAGNQICVGDLVLDPGKYRITKGGNDLHLAPKDFALLEFFMRNPDQVFSVPTIMSRVWSYDSDASSEGLRTAIRRIRKVIDKGEDPSDSMIENVARIGYRLKSPKS
ncbi:MAG: response regulator transcription factor [Cyanobacteria bacterium SZAS-4]|nr:response regulator transcription factor [Cyanobacteria bacterium SZAS-4]